MMLSEWVRPYVEKSLGRLGNVSMTDEGDGGILIEGSRDRGGPQLQKVVITVWFGRKVAKELHEDIASANQAGQDLIGTHIANRIDKHLPNGGVDVLTIGIHID